MNEERYIADLLDSLVIQEGPVEIVVVDAASQDRTQEIVRRYEANYPELIKMYIHPGRRGESTNFGISKARGDVIAFTGGDDLANPNWVRELRKSFTQGADIVAGRSIMIGLKAWEDLDRVELYHKGYDCLVPVSQHGLPPGGAGQGGRLRYLVHHRRGHRLELPGHRRRLQDRLEPRCHHLPQDEVHCLRVLQAGLLERGRPEGS